MKPIPLQPLADHSVPPTPADESIRQLKWRIWRYWKAEKKDPFIADETLERADQTLLDRLIPRPAFGPILNELTETFVDWISMDSPSRWLQLVVLPPCDHENVLRTWAEREGYQTVESPSRDEIFNEDFRAEIPVSDSVVVVPCLESWFLRHHEGLRCLMQLLDDLAQRQQRIVVGCNSWAWSFLQKATHASLVLSTPLTLQPFDGGRDKNTRTNKNFPPSRPSGYLT